MKAVFPLPSGKKVRTETKRDFVLVCEDSTEAWIERRSDFAGTIESHATTMQRRGSTTRRYFGNTVTGELRDLP